MSDNPKKPENEAPDVPDSDASANMTDSVLVRPATNVLTLSDGESEPETLVEASAPPAQLGSARYVHAAFFGATTLAGYLSAKLFTSIWNWLVEWPFVVQRVPQLLRLSEDERGSVGSVVGAVVGILLLIYVYKRPKIRTWAEEVASELTKVSWPDRDTVTKGTVIVIVASLIATVYVTILDRLWGFATRMIYGS